MEERTGQRLHQRLLPYRTVVSGSSNRVTFSLPTDHAVIAIAIPITTTARHLPSTFLLKKKTNFNTPASLTSCTHGTHNNKIPDRPAYRQTHSLTVQQAPADPPSLPRQTASPQSPTHHPSPSASGALQDLKLTVDPAAASHKKRPLSLPQLIPLPSLTHHARSVAQHPAPIPALLPQPVPKPASGASHNHRRRPRLLPPPPSWNRHTTQDAGPITPSPPRWRLDRSQDPKFAGAAWRSRPRGPGLRAHRATTQGPGRRDVMGCDELP